LTVLTWPFTLLFIGVILEMLRLTQPYPLGFFSLFFAEQTIHSQPNTLGVGASKAPALILPLERGPQGLTRFYELGLFWPAASGQTVQNHVLVATQWLHEAIKPPKEKSQLYFK